MPPSSSSGAWSCAAPMSYTLLFHMGGAVRRLSDDDTAFTGRDATHANFFRVNQNIPPG